MRCTAGRVPAGRPLTGPSADRLVEPGPTIERRNRAVGATVMAGRRSSGVGPYPEAVARPRTPKGRARETASRLADEYPGSAQDLCALDFTTPFQLLVATVLSAQTTDERVNLVTPTVFARYPTPADLGHTDPAELETLIHSTGFFRSKARSLIGLGRALDERFGGDGAARHRGPGHVARAWAARRRTWCAASASDCPGCRSTPT